MITVMPMKKVQENRGLGSQKPGVSAWPWLCCSISETKSPASPSSRMHPSTNTGAPWSPTTSILFEIQLLCVECLVIALGRVWEYSQF